MPQVGVGVSVMTLTNNGASTKSSMPVQKAAPEFGDERASKTAHIDETRSAGNTYDFPAGCGTSGEALADWFVQRFEDYSLEQQRAGKRKPSSLTAVGVACVITPDEEAVAQWDKPLRDKFVRDAREVYGMWFGAPLDAWAIHVDEGAMAERGLTRDDELGDEGLHLHGAGRMPDKLPDDDLLVEGFGEAGAAAFKKRYRGKDDGCLYRTGSILNGGRLKLLHNIFPIEMAKRGWREPVDENDLEATGWSVKPHLSWGEKKALEEETGEVFKEPAQTANKYARTQRWQRQQQEKAAKNAADEKRNTADAERNAAEARRNFRDAEQNIADAAELDARAEEVERAEAEADETRAAAERDAAETRREAQRAAVEGFERPKAVEDYLPEYGSKSNALVAYLTEQVKAQRAGEEPPTVHVPGTRELAEQRAALDRQAAALMARENVLGEREGEVDERERAVDAARADVERRERAVGTAEADVERELAGRRAKVRRLNDEIASKGARVERIDAELEAKGAESKRLDEANEARRAEAARLDAEADEKARWLEGAVEHVREADAYVAQAKADAEATRRAAEVDAERTRAGARAEREEALRGLTDRAEERITGFLGRVVGDVGFIAYRTLSVMVEMGVGGERFASAARTCMDVINAMSEDAVGRPFGQTLAGRVQERVARSFARAFARDVGRDAAVREVDDAPQAGRPRDDVPGL